jgi:hypothetical protein
MDSETTLRIKGSLHFTTGFDWGDEINLAKAAELFPAETQTLPRRRRTPSSIAYQTPPLLIKLPSIPGAIDEIGPCEFEAEMTVFDFGAVAINQRVPFELSCAQLSRLAAAIAASEDYTRRAKTLSEAIFATIAPAIKCASWSDLTEEYVIFQLSPLEHDSREEQRVFSDNTWLAGLLRLDGDPLSEGEVHEATRIRISYGPTDLVLAEWAAAVVIDKDCEDTPPND